MVVFGHETQEGFVARGGYGDPDSYYLGCDREHRACTCPDEQRRRWAEERREQKHEGR